MVSVPFGRYRQLPAAPLAGKVVLDTGNYYPDRDGQFPELDDRRATTSGLVRAHLAGALVVKVMNNIWLHLGLLPRPAGADDRSTLPIASDHDDAKETGPGASRPAWLRHLRKPSADPANPARPMAPPKPTGHRPPPARPEGNLMTRPTNRRQLLLASAGALATATLAACGVTNKTTAAAAPDPTTVAPAETKGGTLGLGIVGLIVKDLPASLAFYRRLGLAVPTDVDTSGGAVRLRMPNKTIFVWETVPYTQAGFDSKYKPTGTGDGDRKVTLEFGFSNADEVTAKHNEMVAAGAPSFQAPVTWTNGAIRFAMIVDPDNNKIGLRWPLAT